MDRERILRIAISGLILAAAAVPVRVVQAASPPTVSPVYQETIGTPGAAQLYPAGIGLDPEGNVYVADTGNYRIEKYGAGTDTLLWSVGVDGEPIGGTGRGCPATGCDSFQEPRAVASDGTYVYVADTDDGIVQVLNASTGAFIQKMNFRFTDPIGVQVGVNGSGQPVLIVSDGHTGNVYEFASFTSTTAELTIPPTAPTEGTRDAATDSFGDVFTDDYRGNNVDMYSPSGTLLLKWPTKASQKQPSSCLSVGQPYGVAVDANNNIYVASSELEVIKVFHVTDNNGTYSVACKDLPDAKPATNVIGTQGTGPGQLDQLRRVAVGGGTTDPLVYAADDWGAKILTYNSTDGSLSTAQPEIGNGVYPPAGGLNQPHTIAIGDGNIYTTDTDNQRIDAFQLPGGTSPFDWGTKGTTTTAADFNWPQGIAVDPVSGNVWVSNTRNNEIDEFSPEGAGPLRELPTTGRQNTVFNWPMDVAFDPSGNMYVANTDSSDIEAYAVPATGEPTLLWETPNSDGFRDPMALTFDATQDRLLILDTYNSRVVSLNPATGADNGVVFGTAGSAPGDISRPKGIAVDAAGNIWIADSINDRVEEFTSAGVFTGQIMGSYGLTGNYSFNDPQGLAFDSNGLLYVADAYNNRIQVYAPQPTT